MKSLRRIGIASAGAIVAFGAWVRYGPLPPLDAGRMQSVTVVDRNGVVLYEARSGRGTRSEWIEPDAIPPAVIDATVAAEDGRFFSHPGIDPLAIARAMARNLRSGRIVEGGSTITQQVAKLIVGDRRPLLSRKLREAVIALRLEARYSKKEILALYLNLAPYGNQIDGIARASRRYFGCAPENLTVAQAAFLASLPQRPTAFNPLRDPKAAARRQARVLGRMRDLGMIDISAFNVARAERLRFSPAAGTTLAQHFVDVVLSRGESEGSQRSANSSRRAPPVPRRGLIRTTLDARLQTDILGIISAQKATLLEHGATSVAVAVLDNRTGEWLAWEGSGDYFGESFGGAIDGVTALRQPGSTLKPFTYALAFENGWSPASVLADVPQSFPTAKEGIVYVPRNYDGAYRGPLRVRAALAGSQNVPAVALASKLGVPALLRLLRGVGFRDLTKTADYYGLGLTLGDAEVTLEQLVTAYAIFARGGVAVHPRFLATTPPVAEPRVFSPTTAFWITDILADSRAREAVFGSGGSLDFPFPVAVKTGTSQAYHDNWTVGYTREVTVGVWVGNFDRRPLRNSTGITGAGPIFHAVMLAAAHRTGSGQGEIVPRPDGVERQPVCATSGLRPSLHCPDIESEWVAAGAPVRFCDWHRDGFVSWPAEFQSWAAAQRRASTPDESQRREPRLASSFLEIVNPPDGATYLVDPTLRGEFQALRLRASAGGVRWRVDGSAIEGEEWPLRPGRHTIVAVDRSGRSDAVTIVVR